MEQQSIINIKSLDCLICFLSRKSFKNITGAVSLSLIMIGCAPTNVDSIAPTISSVTIEEATITINASDEVGVIGYLVTEEATKPSPTLNEWKTTSVITVDEEGTYYAWVKDEAGNVSNSKEVVIEIDNVFERLAKEYDHIAWAINPSTEKTVDGVVYNLTELKQKYGDLYPMVEPLSEQEIKDRWVILVNHLVKEAKTGIPYTFNGGLVVEKLKTSTSEEVFYRLEQYKKEIYNSNDSDLSLYKKYYRYSTNFDKYAYASVSSLSSRESGYGVGMDNINDVPLSDMEWFIRDYTTSTAISINAAIKKEEPEENIRFWFDSN
jgi:hypothetical protein